MKFVKRISLFFVYPLIMFGIGVYVGVECTHFFYPGANPQKVEELSEQNWPEQIVDKMTKEANQQEAKNKMSEGMLQNAISAGESFTTADVEEETGELVEVDASSETLSVDTQYVLEETDMVNQSVVETILRLPAEYVGLNREQFLAAMEEYEIYPPLSELERGFVSLEVLSFSRERVVVQMNYQYVQPSNSFYLAVRNNEVVVYLEDMETIYINTGIELSDLPEDVQLDIIQMLWIEDEETLYHFLESYSS